MKSLLITNDFPPVPSGIGTVFFNIWRFMPPDENLILSPKVPGGEEFDRKHSLNNFRYPFFPSNLLVLKLINFLSLGFTTIYIVLRKRPKLLHAGQIWTSGTLALFLKKVCGIKYFLWLYGGETTTVYKRSRLHSYLVDQILKNATMLVTNSHFTTQEFLAAGFPRNRILEILPAVDSALFSPRPPSTNLLEKYKLVNKKIILTVARLTPRKGQDTVIRSLPLILAEVPETLYLVVGSGPYQQNLKQISKDLDVEEKVVFTGYVPEQQLPDYYNLADVYVMPNREVFDSTDSIEGFGISFIEANACGKPVVGGLSGGAVEAIVEGKTGFLVQPNDVKTLAKVVVRLLKDGSLRKTLGEEGRRRVEKSFQWYSRAQKLIDEMAKVCPK